MWPQHEPLRRNTGIRLRSIPVWSRLLQGLHRLAQQEGIAYTIGGMQFVQNPKTGLYLTFDGNRQEFEQILDDIYEGKITALVEGYYGLVREMLMKMTPNIVAHLDVIKKNNASGRYFDEEDEWYRDEVMKTLGIFTDTYIVEVNTGGMAKDIPGERPLSETLDTRECFAWNQVMVISKPLTIPSTSI
jgi:histidinol-phosphatase (PHP family)